MNPDSASSASSGAPQASTSSQRKERGAIAAQACDTCRSRKQKCDEQRPKCGLCQRMKLECRYREPQPTKKDKTLVEILDRLKSLEGKVDRLPTRSLPPTSFGGYQASPSSQLYSTDEQSPYNTSSLRPSTKSSPAGGTGRSQPYRHASAAYKMLTWPAIQQMLLTAMPATFDDLQHLEAEGSAFIVRLQKNMPKLPLDVYLRSHEFGGMLTQPTRNAGAERVTFPDLTYEIMTRLANTYFDTFNLLYPFMDRQSFLSDTIAKVSSEGFNGDNESAIALLVFALGELAHEASRGAPVAGYNGRASGVRGGTIERPPGLALFNEARKRIGFVITDCDLENVQIFSLAALYYQSCSRHVGNLTSTLKECITDKGSNSIDWSTPRGDLINRAFWHCTIMETGLHLELDLPLTGLVNLADKVGLPSFNSPFCEADHRGNEYSHFENHFASQIALRRLCAILHESINDSMNSMDTSSTSQGDDFYGPTAQTLKTLSSQLDQWRALLPRNLQWPETEPMRFPATNGPSGPPSSQIYSQALDPSLGSPGTNLFSVDLDREPTIYPYVFDIQVGLLRTRYYYARYMVHRPFIYKALHHPESMTQSDAEGAAECLRCMLYWPLSLNPSSRRKRLVPYLFCWSQNFLGILLLLHMTQHSPILRQIKERFLGDSWDQGAEETVDCLIDWIRDLRVGDAIAGWCWGVVKGVYGIDN